MTFPVPLTVPTPRWANTELTSTELRLASAGNGIGFPAGKHRRHPSVSVVIPALNEAENLPHVLPKIPVWVDEVLIVDGNSTDGTPEVARRLLSNVRIMRQQGKGKGAALAPASPRPPATSS
jgi:cellulose synthase/poly-beta-1,6-N-acetylglucosamine synthase-like glycosyltransferase